jgi:protein arginine N-methyltransferase 1
VSEVIGSEPLAERVLEVTRDAVRRMVKPGGRLVPRSLRVFGVPVSIPPGELVRWSATQEAVTRWRDWYGLDFSPVYREASRTPRAVLVTPAEARRWMALAPPALLGHVDLAAIEELCVDTTVRITTSRAGRLDGLLVYFEAELSEGIVLRSAPADADDASCWACPVWIVNDVPTLRTGDGVTVGYRYGTADDAHVVRIARA